jgi:hypothetical protein
LEQTDVFDGNDRVVGKRLDESDLRVVERADFFSSKRERADWFAFAQERDAEYGAVAARLLYIGKLILGVRKNVEDLNSSSLKEGSTDGGPALRTVRELADEALELAREARESNHLKSIPLAASNVSAVRIAKFNSSVHNRLQNGVEVECPLSDGLDNRSNCGLALLGAVQVSTKASNVLLVRRRLSQRARCYYSLHPFSTLPDAAHQDGSRSTRPAQRVENSAHH